ncbi:hypothetical protein [Acetobacter ghanensis]|nr:hypothetical protein [Acetobacter ghanensis]
MTTGLAEAFYKPRLNARSGVMAGRGRRMARPGVGNRMGEGTAA